MKKFLLLTLLAASSLTACKKDKETPAPSKTDLLSGKNWIISAQTVSPGLNAGNGVIITDLYSLYDVCDKDDFIRFEKPSVLKFDEGATKCDQSSPQTTTGTWVFNADQTVITLTQGGASQEETVGELTDGTLKLVSTEAYMSTTYTVTTTYRKG